MPRDPKLDLLARVPLFSGLGRRELEEVGALADEVDLPACRALTHEGQTGREFFLIVQGRVAIEKGGRRVASLGPGDFLGEIALVDGGPRSATATLEEPGRVLLIEHRAFHSLLERFPKVQLEVLKKLAERVRRLDPQVD